MLQTQWARALIEALCRGGIDAMVVSPGSRSTPILCAAIAAGMRLHTIIDERSAAFFALGMARAGGEPVALLCTSGTAGAHYYPAILEASYASVPLLAITADRPAELHDCGAPQAMDQTALFGGAVRGFVDLGAPDAAPAALRGIRRRMAQAIAKTRWPRPGPVHINAAFRKPLEPAAPANAAERALVSSVDALLAEPLTRFETPTARASEAAVEGLAKACAGAERGLIVAGPAHLGAVVAGPAHRLAAATGFPLLAEAASGLRFVTSEPGALVCDGFDLLLRSSAFAAGTNPDLVIQLGAPPISTAWNRWVAGAPAVPRWVITSDGWPDPSSTATAIVSGDVADTLGRLGDRVTRTSSASWIERFDRGNRVAWQAVETALGGRAAELGEGHAMRAVAAALPSGARLMLANSLPVRTIDAFCPAAILRAQVLVQRGLSGIDGSISSAAGAARISDRPLALVLGDVSFAHDAGGLAAAQLGGAPLIIVVIDNGGGRIFDHLPIARAGLGDAFERHWRTAPRIDLSAAARAFGHRYAEASSPAAIGRAVAAAASHDGCTVIRAPVAPESAARSLDAIVRSIDAAWREAA